MLVAVQVYVQTQHRQGKVRLIRSGAEKTSWLIPSCFIPSPCGTIRTPKRLFPGWKPLFLMRQLPIDPPPVFRGFFPPGSGTFLALVKRQALRCSSFFFLGGWWNRATRCPRRDLSSKNAISCAHHAATLSITQPGLNIVPCAGRNSLTPAANVTSLLSIRHRNSARFAGKASFFHEREMTNPLNRQEVSHMRGEFS